MGEKFNIIYADPPWKFQTYSERGSQLKSTDCHYSCMKFDDILSLPVESIAADDSILFLWVTFPLLKEGLEVMKAWGFTYKTCGFNWVKRNKKADSFFLGLGYWTRSNSEICLLGTRGHPSRQCHLVQALARLLPFRQRYWNSYLCLLFCFEDCLTTFRQHKKTDCHLPEKTIYFCRS